MPTALTGASATATATVKSDAIELHATEGTNAAAIAAYEALHRNEGTAHCFDNDEIIPCVADRSLPAVEPGAPTVTDIATFQVEVATAHNQPEGWGVVGKATNFYTEGGVHEVTGTLLGRPATVRFTPVAWTWDYGDGHFQTLSTGGKPWTQEARFRPTPTSHEYDEKADYTVTLMIDYAAEYQYAGQPWKTVNGILRVRANDLDIITWRVKTVLVAHDCIEDPKGIGCPGTLTR